MADAHHVMYPSIRKDPIRLAYILAGYSRNIHFSALAFFSERALEVTKALNFSDANIGFSLAKKCQGAKMYSSSRRGDTKFNLKDAYYCICI